MKLIVHSNPLGASPELYRETPDVIAGCFGSAPYYYVSRWEWAPDRERATVLDKEHAIQVLTEARARYEHIKTRQPIKITFTVVEK